MSNRNFICLVFSIIFCQATLTYHSAGVVPVFRPNHGHGIIEIMLLTPVPGHAIKKTSNWDSLLFSDISAVKKDKEDPAHTAARAFFDQQTRYHSVESLAQALAHEGKSFDMGNDHVTFFLSIPSNNIKIVNARGGAAIDKSAIIVPLTDLFDSIHFAQKNNTDKGVKVHDQNGNLWTLFDKFVQGLVNNERGLHTMHLPGI
jgi:hypothetical protein